jgi:hypothetical protein
VVEGGGVYYKKEGWDGSVMQLEEEEDEGVVLKGHLPVHAGFTNTPHSSELRARERECVGETEPVVDCDRMGEGVVR